MNDIVDGDTDRHHQYRVGGDIQAEAKEIDTANEIDVDEYHHNEDEEGHSNIGGKQQHNEHTDGSHYHVACNQLDDHSGNIRKTVSGMENVSIDTIALQQVIPFVVLFPLDRTVIVLKRKHVKPRRFDLCNVPKTVLFVYDIGMHGGIIMRKLLQIVIELVAVQCAHVDLVNDGEPIYERLQPVVLRDELSLVFNVLDEAKHRVSLAVVGEVSVLNDDLQLDDRLIVEAYCQCIVVLDDIGVVGHHFAPFRRSVDVVYIGDRDKSSHQKHDNDQPANWSKVQQFHHQGTTQFIAASVFRALQIHENAHIVFVVSVLQTAADTVSFALFAAFIPQQQRHKNQELHEKVCEKREPAH
mmetsp:Transcript_31353/g.50447  ORF Transcript_31353/g.50447 Transcript_31353/m.50447 type:complete len:355 (+) Transcript_31353:1055-2119(+)